MLFILRNHLRILLNIHWKNYRAEETDPKLYAESKQIDDHITDLEYIKRLKNNFIEVKEDFVNSKQKDFKDIKGNN